MEDQGLAALKAQIDAFDAALKVQAIAVADAMRGFGGAAPEDETIVANLREIVIQSLALSKFADSFAEVMATQIVVHYRRRMIEHADAAVQIADDLPGKEPQAAVDSAKGAHPLRIVRGDVGPKE